MRKFKNGHGDICYSIKIYHSVTRKVFANALAEEAYSNHGMLDFSKLSKKQGMTLLKYRLDKHGVCGEYNSDGEHDFGTEHIEEFNKYYDLAIAWVKKNYVHLKVKGDN